ncbi:enoyl-CoA hydratase/isomerase family protein [Extensimonas sp. H3M7-6]|uniref:enoyl-CoA hydratase/isomerase family protein n=1 Tax=Extensimonas soli TaxID=3031322 RepID=UPI0023DAADB5|nr:enoyl-CoA hydratase-related protein [Extensimonas sp. H3M7-6]MDF1483132.1 enoyl-CoA hydratase-related protein [Extensimonas sp. H3M7-6]
MTIRVETVGGVAKVTIDNPAQKNALTNDMKVQLLEAFRSFADDDAVRAVVLTGAGNAFCAGSDVSSMGKMDMRGGRHRLHVAHSMLRAMVHLEKPILAAVRGPAVGVGWSMAMACDYILASPQAKFGQVFKKVGLAPDGGSVFLLSQYVGVLRAKELVLSGRMLSGEEALKLDLVTELVEDERLEARAMELASDWAQSATLALGMAKCMFVGAAGVNFDTFLELESHVQNQLLVTHDHKEGVAAFLEKRTPKFIGS